MTGLNTSIQTATNKYPEVFSAMQEVYELANPFFYGQIKIMSFGCSSGLEVKTLRDKYFHHSDITGCDINEVMLEKAKHQCFGKDIHYLAPDQVSRMDKQFDIIFCLNVLCKPFVPGAGTDPKTINYTNFNAAIKYLYKLLSMGGYLVVYNSNYNVVQSALAQCFVPVNHKNINRSANADVPLINPDGTQRPDDALCIFKKVD